MTSEEDLELKDLVVQTLESNGVLPKLRAQLRANVFLALDESSSVVRKQNVNPELENFTKTDTGILTAFLINDFLQHFNLSCTLSVFNQESRQGEMNKFDRQTLCRQLGLPPDVDGPLLEKLINLQKFRGKQTGKENEARLFQNLPVDEAKENTANNSLFDVAAKNPLVEPKTLLDNIWKPAEVSRAQHQNAPQVLTTQEKDVHTSDDYEEDFQSSLSIQSEEKSRSDQSVEEEIEEELSVTDRDSQEDATTDRTVSQISAGGIDYLASIAN